MFSETSILIYTVFEPLVVWASEHLCISYLGLPLLIISFLMNVTFQDSNHLKKKKLILVGELPIDIQ